MVSRVREILSRLIPAKKDSDNFWLDTGCECFQTQFINISIAEGRKKIAQLCFSDVPAGDQPVQMIHKPVAFYSGRFQIGVSLGSPVGEQFQDVLLDEMHDAILA